MVGCNANTEDETKAASVQESDIDWGSFVLIHEGIYEHNKSLFEYEKYSIMSASEGEEGVIKTASDWYILPESFENYDNDGKKDAIFLAGNYLDFTFHKFVGESEAHSNVDVRPLDVGTNYSEMELYWYIVYKEGIPYHIRENIVNQYEKIANGDKLVLEKKSGLL